MADDTIKFGDTVWLRHNHRQQFMVLDVKPNEKKGDWTGWYKVIRLTPADHSSIAQRAVGEIAFVRHAEVTKVK